MKTLLLTFITLAGILSTLSVAARFIGQAHNVNTINNCLKQHHLSLHSKARSQIQSTFVCIRGQCTLHLVLPSTFKAVNGHKQTKYRVIRCKQPLHKLVKKM